MIFVHYLVVRNNRIKNPTIKWHDRCIRQAIEIKTRMQRLKKGVVLKKIEEFGGSFLRIN
ncbi:hypothetical protein B2D07_09725 [Desulfococcus multivorans]|nr:hypothetical protein B2D07_09725 [Desulfococcus multivorans]